MASSPEEIRKHIRLYLGIGIVLLVLTAVTVGLSYVDFGSHTANMVIGLAVATFKCSLVVLIFMHLNNERPLIYKILAFAMLFLGVMFVLFINALDDGLIMKNYQAVFGQH
jgi:caa(3)-type oxidase subunit IV